MTEPLSAALVAEAFAGLGSPEPMRPNRLQVTVTTADLREALGRALGQLRCDHVVQVAAADNGKTFELLYHLTGPHRTIVTVRVELPREKPEVPSVHDLVPPAGIYERQVHDLFGIVFVGHPNLGRIILNEDWPQDEFPLRKDWKPKPGTFYGGVPPGGF